VLPTMKKSLLAAVEMAPRDPILGITEAFVADPNPKKVNLGVGVYYDDNAKVPVLECVRKAELMIAERALPHSYLPIDGLQAYNQAMQKVLFGAESQVLKDKRVVTIQALGGTGALKVGADLLHRINPSANVWISDPSWENHQALFEYANFTVKSYAYYDAATQGVNFDGMMKDLGRLPPGEIIVLHVCCHNPTGVDLSTPQWKKVIEVVNERNLLPFLDCAYQGFADGLEEDGAPVRWFAESCPVVLVASSFSKSLSLYGERVGALSVVLANADEAARVLSQLKRVIRTNYSNPATHGAQAVTTVLTTPDLRAQWEVELGQMRDRIKLVRRQLVEKIRAIREDYDMSFITQQRGLFSYSGLSKAQVERLRNEFSVYAIESGRICVAAVNVKNIDYVANAIAKVL
jgi:aromatic-amino-acid transaminase